MYFLKMNDDYKLLKKSRITAVKLNKDQVIAWKTWNLIAQI